MESKMFHIGDLIAVCPGYLVAKESPMKDHPIGGVYKILNFMADDNLFTHQLPRVGKECEPILLEQHPWLQEIELAVPPGLDRNEGWDYTFNWLQSMIAKYGEWHEVIRMHSEDHEHIEPLAELEKIVPPEKIITITSEKSIPPEGDINW